MSKKMLINAVDPEEARVAIVRDGRLEELDIEIAGSEQTRGNIYKGSVVRVEPGLQAAFVDIGQKKLGFLQMGELHPDLWQWRDDIPEENRKRRPRIQEVLRRGQELIVQVEKGERDMKGAALTTYLSLPGRYMVVMPKSDSAGISRKVENESDRKKLKEMAAELSIPEGIGYIIRTEALGRKKTELNKDLQSLLKLHREILSKAKKAKPPILIYQESDLVIRTIRDYFTAEIDEVLVDNPEVYKQAKEFFKRTMPKQEQIVKLHQEKRPIFSKYQLEEQIDQIYEKKVPLKSGGSLVIEPTEALVSIDVNSGKSTGEKGVEETAFKTNLEAAEEAARQLRLRDLGGLIVIDFIDMRDKKHNSEVEKALKQSLKSDKARVTVGKISQFGMLEMSRQRIRQSLEQGSVLSCPHCEGRGKVKSVENMAISFLRKVHAAAAKGTVAEVYGGLPLEVAYYLLNRKKRDLVRIETEYEIAVTVKGKPSFLMNQLELDLVRREKPVHLELPQDEISEPLAEKQEPAVTGEEPRESQAVAGDGGDHKKKKRRRRKKAKGEAELHGEAEGGAPAAVESAEEDEAESEQVGNEPGEDISAAEEGEKAEARPSEHKKKRRRRRRRGKAGAGDGVTSDADGKSEGDTDFPGDGEQKGGIAADATSSDDGLGDSPAKDVEVALTPAATGDGAEIQEIEAAPAKKPARKRAPRKKKTEAPLPEKATADESSGEG